MRRFGGGEESVHAPAEGSLPLDGIRSRGLFTPGHEEAIPDFFRGERRGVALYHFERRQGWQTDHRAHEGSYTLVPCPDRVFCPPENSPIDY